MSYSPVAVVARAPLPPAAIPMIAADFKCASIPRGAGSSNNGNNTGSTTMSHMKCVTTFPYEETKTSPIPPSMKPPQQQPDATGIDIPTTSSLDADLDLHATRSLYAPQLHHHHPPPAIPRHHASCDADAKQTSQPPMLKGPAHWLAPAAPIPAVVPKHDLSPSTPSCSMLGLQRADSVPSSSGSTVSCLSHFGSACDLSSQHTSPRRESQSPLVSLVQIPPCPLSLWYGCEDADHARSVLNTYASKLQLYTQRAPGCRAPLEFIGRVRRDRLDVAKLHRVVDHARSARHRHPPATVLRKHISLASACFTDFTPPMSSSPCFTSGSLALPPNPLDHLPPVDSFTTLDLVSVYSRDTLPLGQTFPLIRHEWLATSWNEADGIPETITRIHTEYPQPDFLHDGEEKRENDEEEEEEDEEDSASKAALQLFIKSVAKPSSKSIAPKVHDGPVPLTASISSIHPDAAAAVAAASSHGFWHPAASHLHQEEGARDRSSSSGSGSPAASPPLITSFLYCLPVFSEDVAAGSYDTFGCRFERETGTALASSAPPTSASSGGVARLPRQIGSAASVGDHALGYSGCQNACIYECMKLLRPSACGIGSGSDDSTGEALCAPPAVAPGSEMAALSAALARANAASLGLTPSRSSSDPSGAVTDSDSANEESDGEEEVEEEEEEEEEDEDDDLDSIGEELHFTHKHSTAAATTATPAAHSRMRIDEQTGFDFASSDSDGEECAEEEEEEEEEESGSDSASDSECASERGAAAHPRSSAPRSIAIARPSARGTGARASAAGAARSTHFHASSSDEESDECDSPRGSRSSRFQAAGSLGDELQAQLAALNGGRAPAAANRSKRRG